ncbi:hypothetical protein ACFL0D_07035 [Thermoproteota archaeon]
MGSANSSLTCSQESNLDVCIVYLVRDGAISWESFCGGGFLIIPQLLWSMGGRASLCL